MVYHLSSLDCKLQIFKTEGLKEQNYKTLEDLIYAMYLSLEEKMDILNMNCLE